MKTFYIPEESGYRIAVLGRAVNLYTELPMFQHKVNNRYIIRCRATGTILGSGETVGEASRAAIKTVEDTGLNNLKKSIKILNKTQGPGKGGEKQ